MAKSKDIKQYEAGFRIVRGDLVLAIRRHQDLHSSIINDNIFYYSDDFKYSFRTLIECVKAYYSYPDKYTSTGLIDWKNADTYMRKFDRYKNIDFCAK